jgi:hypothetical protein
MTCLECRGACCEDLTTPRGPRWTWAPWTRAWLKARGLDPATCPTGTHLGLSCPELDSAGKCQIQDRKPLVCKAFREGGKLCLETQKKRRNPLT